MSDLSGVVQKPKTPPGREMVDEMSAAGFSASEIADWKRNETRMFKDAGFNQTEIDAHWGETPPDPAPAQALIAGNLAKVPLEDRAKVAKDPWSAFSAGWDASNIGMAWGGKPTTILPEDASVPDRIMDGAGRLAGDAPAMVAGGYGGFLLGAAMGAPLGPPGAAVGGLAGLTMGSAMLPAALRELMLGYYNRNEISTWNEFAEILGTSSLKVGIEGVAGLTAGVAGPVAGRLSRPLVGEFGSVGWHAVNAPVQAGTYAAVSGYLNGHVPNAKDFTAGGVLALGVTFVMLTLTRGHAKLKAGPYETVLPPKAPGTPPPAGPGIGKTPMTIDGDFTVDGPQKLLGPPEALQRTEKNLQEIYVKTGIHPIEAGELAQTNPALRQDIMAQNILGQPKIDSFKAIAKEEPEPFVEAFHGSGADVDKLSTAHIGTGQGAQSFGHGLYFAENSAVAETYRPLAASGKGGGMTSAGVNLSDRAGTLYKARLNVDKNNLLDWDAPLSEQPLAIQKVLEKFGVDPSNNQTGEDIYRGLEGSVRKGKMLDDRGVWVEAGAAAKLVSQRLYEAGIPGIRYLDQGSRTKGEGTSNFVIFDDSLIEITEKNGQPVSKSKQLAVLKSMREEQAASGGKPPGPPNEPPPPPPLDGDIIPPPKGPKKLEGEIEPPKSAQEIHEEFNAKVSGLPDPKSLASYEEFYTNWISELRPAARLDKIIEAQGFDLDTKVGFENLLRETFGSSGRAMHFVRHGIIDGNGDRVSDVALVTALQLARQNGGTPQGLRNFMLASRTVDKAKQGVDTGFPLPEAARLIELEKHIYQESADAWTRVMHGALDYAVDKNLYSPLDRERMIEQNPIYIMMRRVLGDNTPLHQAGGKFRVVQPLKNMEGSDANVIEPMAMSIDSLHQLIKRADINQALVDVVDLAAQYKLETFIDMKVETGKAVSTILKKVKATIAEPGSENFQPYLPDDVLEMPAHKAERARQQGLLAENQFIVMRKGEPALVTVADPAMARLIKSLGSRAEAEFVSNWFRKLASAQRTGIVSSPDQPMKTGVFGQISAYILDPLHPPPFVTAIKTFMDVVGSGERYQDWLAHGGATSIVDLDANYLSQDLHRLMDDHGRLTALWNTLRHPIEAAQILNFRLDAIARVGYKDYAEKKGLSPRRAALQSRVAHLDYAEAAASRGSNMLAHTVPFFRSGVLATQQIGKAADNAAFGDGAAKIGIATTAAIIMPSVLLYLANYFADKDENLPENRKYRSLDRQQRDNTYMTPEINGFRISIRGVPGIHTLVNGSIVRFLDYFLANDPHAFDDFAKKVVKSFSVPFIPPPFIPLLEGWGQKDTNTDRPLIPGALKDASPSMQYKEDTTEAAKAITRLLGRQQLNVYDMSPIQLEQAVQAIFGTVGQGAMRGFDYTVDKSGRPWEVADYPFVRSFVAYNPRMGAQPIQDFFAAAAKLKTNIADQQLALKRLSLGGGSMSELDAAMRQFPLSVDDIKHAIGDLKDLLTAVNNLKTVTSEEYVKLDPAAQRKVMTIDDKRQKNDQLYTAIINLSRGGLKMIDKAYEMTKQQADLFPSARDGEILTPPQLASPGYLAGMSFEDQTATMNAQAVPDQFMSIRPEALAVFIAGSPKGDVVIQSPEAQARAEILAPLFHSWVKAYEAITAQQTKTTLPSKQFSQLMKRVVETENAFKAALTKEETERYEFGVAKTKEFSQQGQGLLDGTIVPSKLAKDAGIDDLKVEPIQALLTRHSRN